MQLLRSGWRLTRLFVHIVWGVVLTALFAGLLRYRADDLFYQRLVVWWLQKVPSLLGVRVQTFGTPAPQALMVANHISWLDIPLLGGYARPRFLSKQEVRQWPVIGWLAEKAGTLFISRGKAGAAGQASQTITQALAAGRAVLLFPEGTTTNGQDVKTFHARLFAPAFEAQVPVQPIALRYPNAHGVTNPLVPYIGEQSLWENLQGLLREPFVTAEIHFLPPLATVGMDRKGVALRCEQQVRTVLQAGASSCIGEG